MRLKFYIKKLIQPTAVGPDEQPVDFVKNQSSSQFEVDGWVISQFVVEKIVPIAGVHPFPLHELMLMIASVCRLRPPMIFEWGTHIGKSARIFHDTAVHVGIPLQIHSVDLHDEVVHGQTPS